MFAIFSYKCHRVIRENRKSCLNKQIVLEEELKVLQIALAKEEALNKKTESKQREEKYVMLPIENIYKKTFFPIISKFTPTLRNKVQYQLEAIIKRYDSTIMDKMMQIMDIDKELYTANRNLNKLTKIHDKNYAIYEQVVLKYEEQGQHCQQGRILEFMMNFAARKIQRYWRKWRRQLRKKLLQEKRLQNKLLKTKIIK